MNKQYKIEQLIKEAATKELEPDVWRARLDEWRELTQKPVSIGASIVEKYRPILNRLPYNERIRLSRIQRAG